MDILITFEDGTTELRAANSPALAEYDPTDWHPSEFTLADVVQARPEPVVAFLRPGERHGTHALQAWRDGGAMVWCITGGWGKGEPLTGEWRLCRVEAWWHQIERLTRERDATARHLTAAVSRAIALRDAEHRRAEAAEKRLADLRAWAEETSARCFARAATASPPVDTTMTIGSVLEGVVARIDGKEDT